MATAISCPKEGLQECIGLWRDFSVFRHLRRYYVPQPLLLPVEGDPVLAVVDVSCY